MALTRGFIRNAVTTPLDARLMDMAQIVCNADGSPRVGVMGNAGPSIVTPLATMNVAIAAAEFVTSKGKADGVAIFTNDGTVNVAIAAAPASNSRIDVIWVKHNDNTTGDANSTPTFGVTAGTAAASPTKPAIPTGALELATLRVYAGTTAANGGSNTLTNTYQMTASRGGVVPVRTTTERDAWTTAAPGQQLLVIASGFLYAFVAGAWVGWSGYSYASLSPDGNGAVAASQIQRDVNGYVRLDAQTSRTGGTTYAAQLILGVVPAGFRPIYPTRIDVFTFGSGAPNRAIVGTDGIITLEAASPAGHTVAQINGAAWRSA